MSRRRAPIVYVRTLVVNVSPQEEQEGDKKARWWKVLLKSAAVVAGTGALQYSVSYVWPRLVAHVPSAYAGLAVSVGAALTAYLMRPPHK